MKLLTVIRDLSNTGDTCHGAARARNVFFKRYPDVGSFYDRGDARPDGAGASYAAR